MGLLDALFGKRKGKNKTLASKDFKCPNCGKPVKLDWERCHECGTRIKSMFRKKCPKCKAMNELDAKICKECKYEFESEIRAAKKTQWKCPRCGYKMSAYMSRCPVCGVRFG